MDSLICGTASGNAVILERKSPNTISRRKLLGGGLALCAGSAVGSKASLANDKQVTWEVETTESFNRPDSTVLQSILANFADAVGKQDRIQAAVVSLNQQTVFAEAFHGLAVDRAVNIKSISKSVVATLLGVARQQSVIDSLKQPLIELAPSLLPPEASARVGDLTLEDLVTMRAGLERTSGRAYNVWVTSDHWIHHALSRPFVDEPGGTMLYSTGSTHVLGAVLSQLTNRSLYELANDWLGAPLNIDFAPWTRDPQGYYMGGNEMSLSPLHLVKLGELYLANGVMNGQRVLDSNWVQEAFTPRTRSMYSGDGYGYGWFLRDLGGVPIAYARGYGGQVLHIVPSLSLVVAITSTTNQRARSNGYMKVLHDLVAEKLVTPLRVS